VLAAVAAGDQAALEVLYRRLEGRLFRFVVGITGGDAGRAEDAVVETFMDVWRQAGSFRGASSVSTWIFGIARHKALTHVRRRGTTADGDADVALARLPADDPDALATLTATEAIERVRRALDQLSPAHREVIELTLYQEFSYEEVAEIVHCPVNTVKTRAFHARRHLQRLLSPAAAAGA
jgi:RNA polymerase sigma-70 factor, ECF subfamily